jgi:hypothetical protein
MTRFFAFLAGVLWRSSRARAAGSARIRWRRPPSPLTEVSRVDALPGDVREKVRGFNAQRIFGL